jgi:hypothetical protein
MPEVLNLLFLRALLFLYSPVAVLLKAFHDIAVQAYDCAYERADERRYNPANENDSSQREQRITHRGPDESSRRSIHLAAWSMMATALQASLLTLGSALLGVSKVTERQIEL